MKCNISFLRNDGSDYFNYLKFNPEFFKFSNEKIK